MINRFFRNQSGTAMTMVLAFMVLAVPLVTASLMLASTASVDSRVKTDRLKDQYAGSGSIDFAINRLLNDPGYANSLLLDQPDVITFDLNGKVTSITITRRSMSAQPQTARWADISIALDNSGSIDFWELIDLKAAANSIVDGFALSTTEGRMRIGVSRFRGSSASVIPMTDIDDHVAIPPQTPLHNGINGIQLGGPGLSGGTNIVAGLSGAKNQFATGLGDRGNVPNLIIFITDGDDTEGNSNSAISLASQNTGAEVFAVGVGTQVDINTLNAIATDDDPTDPTYDPGDPNAGHRFQVSEFSGLINIINDLVSAVDKAAQNSTFEIKTEVNGKVVSDTQLVLPP